MLRKSNFRKKSLLSYNPDDVNIRVQHFRISDLINMLNKGNLDIFENDLDTIGFWPKYDYQLGLFPEDEEFDNWDEIEIDIDEGDDLQRNTSLWNIVQKSRFIESLMINLPIPVFYFDGSQRPWRVVDGLQRLHTIRSFLKNEFRLTDLEYLILECEKKYFSDTNFPGYLKARILNAEIIAYVINPGTPPNVKYNIFKRINTGGLQLNGQEIRNAFFHGQPADFTKKLADLEIFKEATNYKVSPRRMLDREYVNRFIAFQIFGFKDYTGKMDLFLSEAMMELYDWNQDDLYDLEISFKKSLKRALKIFDKFAFYRPHQDKNIGRQPNKALFDTLMYNLNMIDDSEFLRLEKSKTKFINEYRSFMLEDAFIFRTINDTTGSKYSVITRFERLNKFIRDFLNDNSNKVNQF